MNRTFLATAILAALAGTAHAQIVDDTKGGNPNVEAQAKGQFPELVRPATSPAGVIQHAWDKAAPAAGIRRVAWKPEDGLHVITREAMTTTIRIPTWDTIRHISLADRTFFGFAKIDDTTVDVFTKTPGGDTSLKLFGDSGNIYTIYLRSETWNSQNIPDLTVYLDSPAPEIVNVADDDGPRRKRRPTAERAASDDPDWLRKIPFDPTTIRRDRVANGDQALAPDDLFRDSQFTYVCYGDRADNADLKWPAPFEVVDGIDTQVNFSTKNGCLIVDTIGPITLRSGQQTLCIRAKGKDDKPNKAAQSAWPFGLFTRQDGG